MPGTSPSPDPQLRSAAHAAFLAGRSHEAASLQVEAVNEMVLKGEPVLRPKKLLALYLFQAGDYPAGLMILQDLIKSHPEDSELHENAGVMLRKMGRYPEALVYLEEAYRLEPRRANICDALAHTYGNLGELNRCRESGERSLRLKDEQVCAKADWVMDHPVPGESPPVFSHDDPGANLIAFSLWGDKPRYLTGAVRNAMLCPDIYPGWRCRFYCDESVPEGTRDTLKKLGAEIVLMSPPVQFYDGLFWRFRVWEDPKVKRFLVRDCDSVINVKERVAVDDWLASGKYFHTMRDFYSHTEVILAGMWGGSAGVLPPVQDLVKRMHANLAPTMTYDQVFLREAVWPVIRQSVKTHDSCFSGALGGEPFPPYGRLPPDSHVGQNEAAVRGRRFLPEAEDLILES